MKSSVDIWSLDHESKELLGVVFLEEFFVLSFDDLNVEVSGLGLDDCLGCYEDFFVDEELGPFSFVKIVSHVKGLSTGAGLIEERRVTDLESGELLDNSLVVKEGLEPALGDFRLVWSVWCVP